MTERAWLKKLRPGSRVVVEARRAGTQKVTREIELVDRITPTGRIVTSKGRTFRPADGAEMGDQLFVWHQLVQFTPEVEAQIAADRLRERHVHFLTKTDYDKEFDNAALERIYDFVCAEMRKKAQK